MNKTTVKLIIIFFFLAIQGCLVEIEPHPPHTRTNIPCYDTWDCPTDTYCEWDGYCYEYASYIECYTDRDCPIYTHCAPNGLCYVR